MFCRNCGETLSNDDIQCPKCGTIIESVSEVKSIILCVSAKSRTRALFLCVLEFLFLPFGLGGLHRIYTGNYRTGVLYGLTGGGFLIGLVYDLYLIFNESFKDGDGFPLYADSSYNSAYKRRPLKNESMKKAVICVIVPFTIIYLIPFIMMHLGPFIVQHL